jgi:hypothetical protein
LLYKHFKSSQPNQEQRKQHAEQLNAMYQKNFIKRTEETLHVLDVQKTRWQSIAKDVKDGPESLKPQLSTVHFSRPKPAEIRPLNKRLGHKGLRPTLRLAPGQMVDVSTDESPFQVWGFAYGGATPQNPSNNSSAGAPPEIPAPGNNIAISVNAGENSQQSGVASAFGYVATYLSPPTEPSLNADLEGGAFLNISTTASTTYSYDWSATYDPAIPFVGPFIMDYATINLNASILVMIYDANWNFLSSAPSQAVTIWSVNNFEGSNSALAIPELVPLSYQIFAPPNFNYGIFIQFYAYAAASGQSPGALVPGSNASATLYATVPAIQIQAVCPD